MKSFVSITRSLSLLAVLLIGFIACGVGGDTGRLSLSLTDKPTNDYQAVYVTIKEVAVHAADDPADAWTVVAAPNKTFNLMALANGVREQLEVVSLTAGHYTQLRLIIGDLADGSINILNQPHPYPNYVIDSDGAHQLKVPSGMQTGVKLVQGFDINENSTTELTFDFDASRSVVVAGSSGKYLLKPTIQVIDTALASVISGTVTTTEGQNTVGVGGALVSVQVYDAALLDPKDQVVVWTSTFTDDTEAFRGAYKFFFAVASTGATVNLVASKGGFAPSSTRLFVENGNAYTRDFPLANVEVGALPVSVSVANAGSDTFATLSFRQTATLDGAEVMIEIMSINVASGSSISVDLPVGAYSVVSSTLGKTTQVAALTVIAGVNPAFAVTF